MFKLKQELGRAQLGVLLSHIVANRRLLTIRIPDHALRALAILESEVGIVYPNKPVVQALQPEVPILVAGLHIFVETNAGTENPPLDQTAGLTQIRAENM